MASSTSLPGARIGKYLLLTHIATGGMGSVYKARDEQLGRIVALKVLDPNLAKNPTLVERFKREAKHASRLQHKYIVSVYDYSEADGHHFIVMEYIQGIDLSEYIRRKQTVHPEEARRILIHACKALEHAYSMGVTHRDIKPSNFLLADRGGGRCIVKLTDLGLSRMVNDEEYRVTRAGTTVGTVDYMAPEQARDSELADVRSDIYSLGCTLYHMLAGQPPFAEGGIGERVYKHMAADPVDVRLFNPKVTASLWTVLRRMLSKHPDDRFQTPAEVIDALRSISEAMAPLSTEEETVSDDTGEIVMPTPAPERVTPDPIRSTPPVGPLSGMGQTGPKWATRRKDPAAEPIKKHKKKKLEGTVADVAATVADAAVLLNVTPDQKKAAAGQFAHASEVIRTDGDIAYATQLLLSCVKLDPGNVQYRKLLREVTREQGEAKRGGWLGSLVNLPARGRLRAAKKAGEHRTVLEQGEELLIRVPGDVATQLDMAEAAEALRLPAMAQWLLEQGLQVAPEEKAILRRLGRLYELQKDYPQATAMWEKIQELEPTDQEASDKIKELAVTETLARSNFRR